MKKDLRKIMLCAQHEFSFGKASREIEEASNEIGFKTCMSPKAARANEPYLGLEAEAPLLNSSISGEAFESRHPVIILLKKHETG